MKTHTECDGRSLLFTIVVRCVDDTKVEQEAGHIFSQCYIFVFIV